MRVAVNDRFWVSRGGGERYAAMLAAVLAAGGDDVELLGPDVFDPADLGAHLGVDLSGVTVRVVPDAGPSALEDVSAEYDLFVETSHMSRLRPRARRNALVSWFPTPLDAGLPPARRRLARALGPVLASAGSACEGPGWWPPEGGPRRQWCWTSGTAAVALLDGPSREVALDLGRPGGAPVDVELSVGDVARTVRVGPAFGTVRVRVPAGATQLVVSSPATSPRQADPASHDGRLLGVAVSRVRDPARRRGLRERGAERLPWVLPSGAGTGFLASYDSVIAISEFTAAWVRREWGVEPDLLLPPVSADLEPAAVRAPVVLGVGRFFAPEHGHSKRQAELAGAFAAAWRDGRLPGDWRLVLVGGVEAAHLGYLDVVRAAAGDAPVEVVANAPRARVRELLQTASVFWAATGLGTVEDDAPWAQEHFGITTVEAMAGGCVPVVIDRAGQREIVRPGVDGYRWSSLEELVTRTASLAADDALRARLSAAAVQRARTYDDDAFAASWLDLVARRALRP